jgi:undecaprenyl-diphosphatase
MTVLKLAILAIVQGLAELLPVSSSAHVVVSERLMGLDPSTPQMTLVLVMLHTGTMFAVITYFWRTWKQIYFKSSQHFRSFLIHALWATFLTCIIGYPIVVTIERMAPHGTSPMEIEDIFGRLDLVGAALLAAGLIILLAGIKEARPQIATETDGAQDLTLRQAGWIGAVQGLCLPFRGFSRSGATISTGLLTGARRDRTEWFSFALAIILTPPVVGRELWRLFKASAATPHVDPFANLMFGLLGAVLAFVAGLVALKWLSSWLESGKWYLFGIYCLFASVIVLYLHHLGY